MNGEFKITEGKGFHITFKNEWVISVQFGLGNYCNNRDNQTPNSFGSYKCSNCEVAVRDNKGRYRLKEYFKGLGGDVKGWVSANEVANLIAWVVRQPKVS